MQEALDLGRAGHGRDKSGEAEDQPGCGVDECPLGQLAITWRMGDTVMTAVAMTLQVAAMGRGMSRAISDTPPFS